MKTFYRGINMSDEDPVVFDDLVLPNPYHHIVSFYYAANRLFIDVMRQDKSDARGFVRPWSEWVKRGMTLDSDDLFETYGVKVG